MRYFSGARSGEEWDIPAVNFGRHIKYKFSSRTLKTRCTSVLDKLCLKTHKGIFAKQAFRKQFIERLVLMFTRRRSLQTLHNLNVIRRPRLSRRFFLSLINTYQECKITGRPNWGALLKAVLTVSCGSLDCCWPLITTIHIFTRLEKKLLPNFAVDWVALLL